MTKLSKNNNAMNMSPVFAPICVIYNNSLTII